MTIGLSRVSPRVKATSRLGNFAQIGKQTSQRAPGSPGGRDYDLQGARTDVGPPPPRSRAAHGPVVQSYKELRNDSGSCRSEIGQKSLGDIEAALAILRGGVLWSGLCAMVWISQA